MRHFLSRLTVLLFLAAGASSAAAHPGFAPGDWLHRLAHASEGSGLLAIVGTVLILAALGFILRERRRHDD